MYFNKSYKNTTMIKRTNKPKREKREKKDAYVIGDTYIVETYNVIQDVRVGFCERVTCIDDVNEIFMTREWIKFKNDDNITIYKL